MSYINKLTINVQLDSQNKTGNSLRVDFVSRVGFLAPHVFLDIQVDTSVFADNIGVD